jgi:RimJ/RimL family protein N-acetyltransferase
VTARDATRGGGTGDGTLETARLRLAPFHPADADALSALFRNPHVRRYMLDGTLVERTWVVEEIDASRARFAAGTLGLFAAHLRESGELAGVSGFRPYEELGMELLYALLPAHCGRGLATEMADAVVALAFRHGWHEVYASVDAPNVHSIRVVERLGFALYEERTGAFGRMIRFVLRAPGLPT